MHDPRETTQDQSARAVTPPTTKATVEPALEIVSAVPNPLDSDPTHPASLNGKSVRPTAEEKTDSSTTPQPEQRTVPNTAPEQRKTLLQNIGSALKWTAGLYFKPKPFERNTKLYRAIGVHHFKTALMATIGKGFTLLNRNAKLDGLGRPRWKEVGFSGYHMDQSEKGMKRFLYSTGMNEVLHLTIGFGTSVPPLLSNLSQGGSVGIAIFAGAFTVVNAYCIFLQRYNRARIFNTLERLERHKTRSALPKTHS